MSSVLQLIYQVSICAFVLQSLQNMFKGRWVGNASSLNFKLQVSLYCICMHQPNQSKFLSIYPRIIKNHKERCKAAVFLPLCVDLVLCLQREREKGERPTQRGQSSRRRAPQPKGQLSTAGGGENNGASARAVWKKDESGSLSISTACCHCSEPQGLRGRGGGRRLGEGERKWANAGADQVRKTTLNIVSIVLNRSTDSKTNIIPIVCGWNIYIYILITA